MNTVEKMRNATDAELRQQERDLMDQLFRLKFQMKMGQTESLNKIRGLRKDVARVKTLVRERALGIERTGKPVKAEAAQSKTAAPAKATAAKATKAKAPAKKAAAKKK
jgi:large subunit ribosomal protein L29